MNNIKTWSMAVLLAAAMMAPAGIVSAQQGPGGGAPGGFQGPGPGGGGFGGPGGGFQQGGRGGGFGGQNAGGPGGGFQRQGPGGGPQGGPITAATLPLRQLSSVVTLTDSQRSQIETIQQDFREKEQVLNPRPAAGGRQGLGQPRPARPDAAVRAQLDDLAKKASDQIVAVLKPDQASDLSTLLGRLKQLQAAQIPPRFYTQLHLSSAQYDEIAKVESSERDEMKAAVQKAASDGNYEALEQSLQDAHSATHDKVIAALTPAQARLIESGGAGGRGMAAQGGRGQGGFGQGGRGGGGGRQAQGFGGGPGGFGGPNGGPDGRGQGGFGGPGAGGPGGGPGGFNGPDAAGGPDAGPGGPDGGPSSPGNGDPGGF